MAEVLKLSRRQSLRLFTGLVPTITFPIHARILTFHEVPTPETITRPVINAIYADFFPTDLDTVTLYVNQQIPHPQPQPFLVVTLDDGRLSQYNNAQRAADIVRAETSYELPLEFFVITRFEGIKKPLEEIPDNTPSYKNTRNVSHMTKGDLVSLAKRFNIRNHTHDHGILPRLSIADRNAQVEDGEAQVQKIYDLAGITKASRPQQPGFCYPYGEYAGQIDYIGNRYAFALSTRKTEFHYPWESPYLGRKPVT